MKMNRSISPINVIKWVPEQSMGRSCDNYAWKELDNSPAFEKWKEVYFDVSNWQDYAGKEKAHFALTDEHGNLVQREPQKGDLVRIKLSILQNLFRKKREWVKIELLDEINEPDFQLVRMTLVPTKSPLENKNYPQHFLTEISSNTFIIARSGNLFHASVHGRNELVNNAALPNPLKWFRNQFVARTGFAGLSSWQWQGWCDGILKVLIKEASY
jgi:hypothetical protein